MTLLIAGVASAQSNLPGSGWWSGEQIQNVGTGDANIVVTAYDSSSSSTYTASPDSPLAPGEAFTFTPSDFSGMPSGFQGSALVESDQPIKAIVNVTNRQAGDLGVAGGKAAAQYQGVDGGAVADTLFFPLVKGDSFGKTTTFYIQNAGDAATTATADFTMRNGDTHSYTTPSIGPNQMVIFGVADTGTFDPADNNGRVGGLVVSADQPLAGVVMEHNTSEDPATILQSTRGFTSDDFDTQAYAPVIKNNRFSRFTGLQVQNVSGGPVDITVEYTGSAGDCAGSTFTDTATGVADGASETFVQSPTSGTNLPENCTASATVTATGNIVAIVNESFFSVPASGQSAVTSSAIPAGSASTSISVPLFKDDRFGKRTGLQIQNVSDSDATITASFNCTGAASFSIDSLPQTVGAGGAVLFNDPSDTTAGLIDGSFTDNVNCSVSVSADQSIVAIANESVTPGGGVEQDNNNYEGFNN